MKSKRVVKEIAVSLIHFLSPHDIECDLEVGSQGFCACCFFLNPPKKCDISLCCLIGAPGLRSALVVSVRIE